MFNFFFFVPGTSRSPADFVINDSKEKSILGGTETPSTPARPGLILSSSKLIISWLSTDYLINDIC